MPSFSTRMALPLSAQPRQPASSCTSRHGISGWCSHQRVTANLPAAGAAAAPRRRVPGEPWSYVFVHEDQDETSKEILRLAVFGKFGDATRPDDHTSPRAHARSSAAASPHPDAVLTRLAAQRSNVLELHSALTTADGHTARRSKLVEHAWWCSLLADLGVMRGRQHRRRTI